ncbi:MAG: mechanosensitive ion channel protein MscS [Proteobacteria bacterium]|nr:MAG: mechanosensitive ion channel protein MscS [Pseudomonadota bacterium]
MDPASRLSGNEVRRLLFELLADFQDVGILWQIAVLLVSLSVAWWIARLFRYRLLTPSASSASPDATLKISVGGVNRTLFPFTALICVVLGRFALHSLRHDAHLLDIVVALLFSWMLVRVLVYVLRHVFGPSGPLRYWERAIAWTIWIGVALYITGLLPQVIALLDSFGFRLGQQRVSVLTIVHGALSIAITVLLALWAGRLLETRMMAAQGLDLNTRVVLSKVARTLLIILAVLIALPLVGIDVTVLSVFGGALGVGLGFGLQKIAANYLSGFAILLDRSIGLGALVTIDGHYGQVTRLTARYVVVKGLDGTEAIIPNETVITTVVVNHSYSDRRVRVEIPIQVGYNTDVDAALRLMETAAADNPRALKDPPAVAVLKRFADSGIDLEMYVWIDDPERGKGLLVSDLNREILKRFRNAGIEIPYPQRDIRLIRTPRELSRGEGSAS